MDAQKALVEEFDRECKKTRKMLEAIPENVDWNYKPHAKSMALGALASHIADMTGDWGIHTLAQDELKFAADHKFEPNIPKSTAALVERFDKGVASTRQALTSIDPAKWDNHWKFIFGDQVWIDQPKHQVFRDMVMNHLVHHRAQLGVYLRLLDAKIPGCYGPSADEM